MSDQAVEDFVQFLTPDGERVQHPDFSFGGSDETIAGYLREMILARRFDSEATALQRKGELGLWPPALGQEAAQVGSANALRPPDFVFPSYREHAIALHLGVDPVSMLSTFRGTAMAPWANEVAGMHPYSFVIGTQTLHAVGYAMGMQRDGLVGNADPDANGATVVYFGDGATSQGDVNEAFIFAASYTAPVVFFCQNNQYAISEPIALQSKIPLYRRASGFGFPGVRVDGNDVLAVNAVTSWALQRARQGKGPTLIEAYTYRMGAHTTSDDPTKYRSNDETEQWRQRDPIARVQAYLHNADAIDQGWLDAVDGECEELAIRLRQGCLALPEPTLEEFFDYAVIDPGEVLLEQRDDYLEYEAGFADHPQDAPGAEPHSQVQEAF